MGTTKLTLSAPEDVIKDAKRIAAENKTSVSAMFTRLLSAVAQPDVDREVSLGPVTLQATGLVKLPRKRTERQLLEDALEDKYGRSR